MKERSERPTIRDVSNLAGVSVATVSRVVNELGGYSPETKVKIQAIIDQLGYRCNAVARSLVKRQSRTIGLLLPTLSSRLTSRFIEGVEDKANELGFGVLICNTQTDGGRTKDYLDILEERQVDAIIILSEPVLDTYVARLERLDIPIVLVSTRSFTRPLPFIKVDDYVAAFDAVSYLIEKGHSKIGYIGGGSSDGIAGQPRLRGYREALGMAGVAVREQWIATVGYSFSNGLEGIRQLHRSSPEITALFVASDEAAVGVLSYAYQHRILIPETLSVVGYDNTMDAIMSIPPLTTVHQPLEEMGATAVRFLVEEYRSKEVVSGLIVKHWIVERDSVGPPRMSAELPRNLLQDSRSGMVIDSEPR